MSVRVVARLRPLLKGESQEDVIVSSESSPSSAARPSTADTESRPAVRIPNPKNEAESFSFHFNSVYDHTVTQAAIFDAEIAPTVKHLFKGCDVTLFAYGVTGTGKTHTMRGGKSLAERGVIPRLLSAVYRRARKIEKDTQGETVVNVTMSYYEIYNDRVFDLFEPPEKRTAAGLPIRDAGNGKSQVVGLLERPCTSLKEFETLYDHANVNRSTSATKLNAHSSRSHAILCVKLTQTTADEVRISSASAIDLAGSEDNRRTDNNKERLVESASINKSLFVLAQCVEAISKKHARVPYRESKMTRILSLGQNNGLTVMILNLSPLRSFHLDTLSSLNFANRTKKVQVNETENQPFYRDAPGKPKSEGQTGASSLQVPALHRQPLKSKVLSQSSQLNDVPAVTKPAKSFAVYSDKPRVAQKPPHLANTAQSLRTNVTLNKSPKRTSSDAIFSTTLARPAKLSKSGIPAPKSEMAMSPEAIEALIERKVSEALAERADSSVVSSGDAIPEEIQKRLDALEKRVVGKESERAEGLQYLLMAKQHQVRGEDHSALKMYALALPHFPENEKLLRKMTVLQAKMEAKQSDREKTRPSAAPVATARRRNSELDDSYHEDLSEAPSDDDSKRAPRTKVRKPQIKRHDQSGMSRSRTHEMDPAESSEDELATELTAQTPRTKQLLRIINTRDVSKIKLLRGVGAVKADAIVNCLCDLEDERPVKSLSQLGKLKGVGAKTVANMRNGMGDVF